MRPFTSPNQIFKLNSTLYFRIVRFSTINTETLQTVPLDYKTYGAKQETSPILVFHAMFGSKSNYNTLCKKLLHHIKPRRQIIAVDLRNHGHSPHVGDHTYPHMAADIKALMQRLAIPKAILLGHSMGGRAVLMFGFMFPSLVESSIVVDISHVRNQANVDHHVSVLKVLSATRLPTNVPMQRALHIVDQMLQKQLPSADVGFRRFLLMNLRQRQDKTYYWRVNLHTLQKDSAKYETFPDIKDKVYHGDIMFVLGDRSPYVRTSYIPQILKTFPKAQIKYVRNAGHLVQIDNPNGLVEACVDFLSLPKAPTNKGKVAK